MIREKERNNYTTTSNGKVPTFAIQAYETVVTSADIRVDTVHTCSSIHARIADTFVNSCNICSNCVITITSLFIDNIHALTTT